MNFTTGVCILKCFKYLIKGPLSNNPLLFLFVSFVWDFSSHSRIFHSYWDVTIAGEGLQISTYARHSWPLSSEGSLACHTYCDTGHPFIMVIFEDLWHSHPLPSVCQWSCHYLFLRQVCRDRGWNPDLPHGSHCYWTLDYSDVYKIQYLISIKSKTLLFNLLLKIDQCIQFVRN